MKRAFILLVLSFMVSSGYSQEEKKFFHWWKDLPTPILEVWGGMGLSSVAGNVAATQNRLAGLFGAGITWPITDKHNLQFEGAYTFQGFKRKGEDYIQEQDTVFIEKPDQRLNYFKLNIMDRYFLDKERIFYVNGGIYMAFLSNARYQAGYEVPVEGTDDMERIEIDDSNKDAFQSFDMGLTAGAGARVGNKSLSNFTVELRFSYGFLNVAKPAEGFVPHAHNIYGVLKLGVDIPVRN